MVGLTTRQAQILEAIIGHLRDHHAPPTIRWLCDTVAIRSTNGMREHLLALERKGFIGRTPGVYGMKVLRFPDGAPLKVAILRA